MTCAEAQDQLHDLTRGRLDPRTADAVRAHIDACPTCTALFRTDQTARTRVRAAAPRYAAPQALRARLENLLSGTVAVAAPPTRRLPGWGHWIGGHRWATVCAGVLTLLVLGWAGWSWWRPTESAPPLVMAAISEHTEYRNREMRTSPAADPQAVVDHLRGEVGYPLPPAFLGDAAVQLMKGEVTDLSGRRAAALVYRDAYRRYSTLFLVPAAGVEVPAQGRTTIETFTPYRQALSGHQVFLWKQGGVACVLVSDLDPADSAAMFLKIRKSA